MFATNSGLKAPASGGYDTASVEKARTVVIGMSSGGFYEQKCQTCHGAKGANQPNDRLVGGQGTLATKAPVRTIGSYWPYATTVFDYVRRAMPYTQPQSLTDDEVYAVTAFLLNLNEITTEQEEMNAQTLPRVTMPNCVNFIIVYPSRPR